MTEPELSPIVNIWVLYVARGCRLQFRDDYPELALSGSLSTGLRTSSGRPFPLWTGGRRGTEVDERVLFFNTHHVKSSRPRSAGIPVSTESSRPTAVGYPNVATHSNDLRLRWVIGLVTESRPNRRVAR